MDERLEKKQLRRKLGSMGWTLLIYNQIMQICVVLACVMEIVPQVVPAILAGEDDAVVMQIVMDSLLGNGWGYALAIAIGLLILRLWKGKDFCYREIWTRGRPMGLGDFLCLLCVFVSGQLLFQFLSGCQEWILNQFGMSALSSIEAASGIGDTFSMFFYAGILAPITEEILFRGLVLRTLLPYGKRFAILMSAFLFGIFHANVVQTPYALFVGLVLGYTAVEHSILWAMVLHMFNNMILADVWYRVSAGWPEGIGDGLLTLFIIALSAAALVILLFRWKDVRSYVKANKVKDQYVAAFFTSPGIIVLAVLMAVNMISVLFV